MPLFNTLGLCLNSKLTMDENRKTIAMAMQTIVQKNSFNCTVHFSQATRVAVSMRIS